MGKKTVNEQMKSWVDGISNIKLDDPDKVEYALPFSELSEEKKEVFDKLAENYSYYLQLIYLFIEVNGLDNDEVWDKANQRYDEDMTYAPDHE